MNSSYRKIMISYLPRVVLSFGVTAFLLSLLLKGSLQTDAAMLPQLIDLLAGVSLYCLFFYVAASIFRTLLRACRYRLIVKVTEKSPPSFFRFFLVTAARNMFVDMLPARLGELSYVAMLNRGYKVAGSVCLSSLLIGFIFDIIALGLLILCLVAVKLTEGGEGLWLIPVLIILCCLVFSFYILFFPVMQACYRFLRPWRIFQTGPGKKTVQFLAQLIEAFEQARQGKIAGRLLLLSLGIRLGKYAGLYALFTGVAASFPSLAYSVVSAVTALISAEAATSLPVPSFMGFGSYEAGGTLAMVALGASKKASVVIMLALHILSQIVDYAFGGLALVVFFFTTATTSLKKSGGEGKRFYLSMGGAAAVSIVGVLLFAWQLHGVKKLGSLRPPDAGKQVEAGRSVLSTGVPVPQGFIVWSSNRNGNHDIFRFSFADNQITPLTTHQHTEYYPRISPDGKRVVFARSQVPWVSQRNQILWDVYVLDIKNKQEQLLARNGTYPTWSQDGQYIYFLRKERQVVQLGLESGKETVLMQVGEPGPFSDTVFFQTPAVHPVNGSAALTLRGGDRAVVTASTNGLVQRFGRGCQLNWSPDGDYLYKIDHGGRQQNAIYKLNPLTGISEQWFDSPKNYSHEYFPKVSNNGQFLVFGASRGGHEHDTADYEIYLWRIGSSWEQTMRITHHTGNDCWPDVFIQ